MKKIVNNSPAEFAGLKVNDSIIAIDNISVNSINEAAEIINMFLPGQRIDFYIKRGGIKKKISVTLGKKTE